jgi:hypothetical protein
MFDLCLQRGVRHETTLELRQDDCRLEDERPVALLMQEVAAPWAAKAGPPPRVRLDDLICHDRHLTPLPHAGQLGQNIGLLASVL